MRMNHIRVALALPLLAALACGLPSLPGAGAPPVPSGGGGTLDCDAFDVDAFNVIVGGTFSLTKVKDDECSFDSDHGWALGISVGQQRTEDQVRSMFETDAAVVSDDYAWDSSEGFPLGVALPRFGTTTLAMGRSDSGFAMSVLATAPFDPSQGSGPPPELAARLDALLREAARQLNAQL